MKYIDAEKLKEEIRIIQQSLEHRDVCFNQVKKIRTECMIEFCKHLYDVIDHLHQEMWKPSKEQMEALKCAVKLYKDTHFKCHHYRIESLYEQLKQL